MKLGLEERSYGEKEATVRRRKLRFEEYEATITRRNLLLEGRNYG